MKLNDSVCGICNCVIRDNSLFAELTDQELDLFKDVVVTKEYDKREQVYGEGDSCSGLYVIRVGRIKLVRTSRNGKEQIIKLLGPGDLLGLEALSGSPFYENTAICMESADLCYISTEDFFRLMRDEPSVATKLISALGRELSSAYSNIGTLGLLNAREKMAHLLYSLAKEYGASGSGSSEVTLNLTLSRLEIAELLGITQETSIRLLKSFKDDGIISIKRKEIVILSMDELAVIANIE